MEKIVVPLGDMGEGYAWEIRFNQTITYGGEPCMHCHGDHRKRNKRHDGSVYYVREWICPRTVVSFNEGSHNFTEVCLDCILAAVKEHGL